MVKLREYVDIKDYCTLKVGGQFRYFIEIDNREEIKEALAFAERKNLKVFPLGSGSNIVFPEGILEVLVLKLNILGFEIITETVDYVDIRIGSGEEWDSVVSRVVEMHLSGIEALSAIPGTAGATPVQNVGAYGQEIKDTLISVEVFDMATQAFKTLSNKECEFAYRDSIFKRKSSAGESRYIITSITVRLSKEPAKLPNYPGVKKYFEEKNITDVSLAQIREAIITIRSVKLPDPKKIANVGSFFKNPIVSKNVADELQAHNPTLTTFPVNTTQIKIPAGWLIEQAGLKGKNFGKVSVYPNNALVLVNNGSATRKDIEHVGGEIIRIVNEKFGITLEAEPEFI